MQLFGWVQIWWENSQQCRPLCTLLWSCRPLRWSICSLICQTSRQRCPTRCPEIRAAQRHESSGSCSPSSSPTCGWFHCRLKKRSHICVKWVQKGKHFIPQIIRKKSFKYLQIPELHQSWQPECWWWRYGLTSSGWSCHLEISTALCCRLNQRQTCIWRKRKKS